MSRGSGRSHAWLSRRKGESVEPFVPKVGELYLVSTAIYSFGHDPAADRPAVVIAVPPRPESRSPIQVVTRTSRSVAGIKHPADMSLRCDRDGVFSDLVSIEQQLWTPQNVERLGVLPEPFLSAVLERFS
jgi:mRNA-degrading endonuclease toxin of MazEF toxin-antitoxin module